MTTTEFFTIVLHIQRTGGSSFDKMLQKQFHNGFVSRQIKHFTRSRKGVTKQEYWKQIKFSDSYYSSHVCYGIHECLPSPYKYLAFVRDPVERIVSLYKYSLQNKDSFYHQVAVGKTFEEFALSSKLHELDNGQARVLAGGDSPNFFINRTPYGQCDEKLLQIALSNIERDFLMVGITEMYDESIVVMSKLYGWKLEVFPSLNSSAAMKVEIPEAVRAEVRKLNWIDSELVEICKRKLKAYFQEDASLAERLAEYKVMNRNFNEKVGGMHHLIDRFKRNANRLLKGPSN